MSKAMTREKIAKDAEKSVIWRHELKYICREANFPVLQNELEVFCDMDAHTGQDRHYMVRSLYFDDYCDTAYYENEMGVGQRRKYRLRMYNENVDTLTLERKNKRNGMGYKESVPISVDLCEKILKGDWMCENLQDHPKLLGQFYLEYRTKLLRPKMIVEYKRIPYVYETGNVRVTFDQYISASGDVEDFLRKDIAFRPIMPLGEHILEVKYDALLPDFIQNAISGEGLRQTTYSKYYLCRKIYGGK